LLPSGGGERFTLMLPEARTAVRKVTLIQDGSLIQDLGWESVVAVPAAMGDYHRESHVFVRRSRG
jgi:hypothetical protein